MIFNISHITTAQQALLQCMSGVAIGLGSIGPVIGLSRFAQCICSYIGTNRYAYNKLMSYTFISGAIIETPLIFAFIISLILTLFITTNDPLIGVKSICAALCIAVATFATSLGISAIAQKGAASITRNPESYSIISQMSMFAQGIIDASAIYALLIALIILFLH